MEFTAAINSLRAMDQQGKAVFTTADLRMLFCDDTDKAFDKTIERLSTKQVLLRPSRGIYVFAWSTAAKDQILYKIATHIRRGCYSYVSLETSLSSHGVISQIPMSLTMMTTGRKGVFDTPYGRIEFTHTKRRPAEIVSRAPLDGESGMRWASPDLALEDLRRVGRNLHLVSVHDYEEVMEDGNHQEGR